MGICGKRWCSKAAALACYRRARIAPTGNEQETGVPLQNRKPGEPIALKLILIQRVPVISGKAEPEMV